MKTTLLCVSFCLGLAIAQAQEAPDKPFVSGIYPHLTMFNDEGECGTGAVVPWANRLWTITYAPHRPNGSSDKLYEITPELKQIIRPESIGGTPANRMIHRESKQLFIGPYVIDRSGNVRIPKDTRDPERFLYGRLTANMRHLTDPAGKIYYATMEEGIYEVDVKTLAAKELNQDGNREIDATGKSVPGHSGSKLPGYHGKGAYTAQGMVGWIGRSSAAISSRRSRALAALKAMPTLTIRFGVWDGIIVRSCSSRLTVGSGIPIVCRRVAIAMMAPMVGTPSGRAFVISGKRTCS